MSLAENLLNSLDVYEVTESNAVEEEPHIIVGSDRVITVPAKLKLIAVKGDKDIETVTIECVRYWDGHDLSTFAIYINYILPNHDEGTYIPKNITKLDDVFTFDWEIGSEITYAQGRLTFWIVAKLTDNDANLIKQWSSLQNSDCNIAQGGDKIYVPEKQTDQDVITQAISISRASAELAEQQANLAIGAANKAALDASQAAEAEVSRIIGELGVVQELGDSPNSVVSQAKVTKEFSIYNSKITRNSKRITNLEQGLPSEQFMTDSTVAHVKDVPVNALPFAEVSKVGGMTRKCTNLFDDIGWFTKKGFTKQSDGSWLCHSLNESCFANTSGRSGSMYINVIAKTENSGNVMYLIVYYTDGTTTSGCDVIPTADFVTVSMTTDASKTVDYVLWSYGSGGAYYLKGMSISFDSDIYEPYCLRSAKVTELKNIGANLFNDIKWFTDWNFTAQSDGSWSGRLLTAKCFTNTFGRSGSVYITFIAKTDSTDVPLDFLAYYTDGTTAFVGELSATNGFETKTIKTDANKTVDYINWTYGSGGTYYLKGVSISFVDRGGYIPYTETFVPIPAEVQALDGYGEGLSADCCNYIDWDEMQFIKKVGKVDMGTLVWSYSSSTGCLSSSILPVASAIKASGKCIAYSVVPKDYRDLESGEMIVRDPAYTSSVILIVKDSYYTDGETFKAAMSGVMLYYELATPEITNISDILPADNYIEVEGGGTITAVNEYEYAVPTEITYQIKGATL